MNETWNHRPISGKQRGTTTRRGLLVALCLAAMALPATATEPTDSIPEVVATIVAGIEESRALKDSLLLHGDDSPLEPAQRRDFAGLDYFPIDLRFHVVGELHAYGRKRQIQLPTTANTNITMERFGRFRFEWGGNPFWLDVYRSLEDGRLSVFFKDATNGSTTYGGGRYAPIADLGNRAYLLDFNVAYNPYCVYNPVYICPLVPEQNILPFPVPAGERDFGADLAQ